MSFAGQVAKLDPHISASGFFNIGKELIPTVYFKKVNIVYYNVNMLQFYVGLQFIGTTLTYFFITYQFHSDEGKIMP